MSHPTVLLLRRPSTETETDKYTDLLSGRFKPISVPVLETVLTGLVDLHTLIRSDGTGFQGVIVTSARACEAWREAIQDDADGERTYGGAGWGRVPFYVVGKTTAAALRAIHDDFPGRNAPQDIRGETSGTAEQLAKFIVEDLDQFGGGTVKLLYLTGDKNRDTLPTILTSAGIGITLHTLQVYETRGSATFERDLNDAIVGQTGEDVPWRIIFFAPSSAEFAYPYLKVHFNMPSNKSEPTTISNPRLGRHLAKIFAIGTTTATYLTESLNLNVCATAKTPTPEGLLDALREDDGK